MLREAQANSDGLVDLEVVAMNAVKGLFRGAGQEFTEHRAPDLELARRLLHSLDYHEFKRQIMVPVDKFFVLMDQRTQAAVEAANRRVRLWQIAVIVSVSALLITLALVGGLLRRWVFLSLSELESIMADLVADRRVDHIPGADRVDELGRMATGTASIGWPCLATVSKVFWDYS